MNGAPWRDLPEYYGPWQTAYKRFVQWKEREELRKLFDTLCEGTDMQDLCIDGTYIKAHRTSSSAKKGCGQRPKPVIGVNCGGRSTKIRAVIDGLGNSLVFI